MARGFNKVTLMGNLARDPEIRYTVDKRAWVRFTVAVGYSWKNKKVLRLPCLFRLGKRPSVHREEV